MEWRENMVNTAPLSTKYCVYFIQHPTPVRALPYSDLIKILTPYTGENSKNMAIVGEC